VIDFEIGGLKSGAGPPHSKGVEMRFDSPLNNVRVAAPCPADWDQMLGNERSRFCGQCNLNVYNLSAMSRSEAEEFIARSEGRVCIRYYRRKDGSVITENCPVGLRALRKKMSYVARAIASAVLTLMTGIGLSHIFERVLPSHIMGDMVVQPPIEDEVFIGHGVMMGKMVNQPLIVDVNLIPPPEIGSVVGQLPIRDTKHRVRIRNGRLK
jgi:hypothetical protein